MCDKDEGWKLVVPTELRNKVIYSAHNPPNMAHGGIAKTVQRIRKFFFWPKLVSDVETYIRNCDICKTSKNPSFVLRPPMGQMVITERPFQRLYVDLIGPFPRTKRGYIGILVILDHFTKFTFLVPLKKLVTKPIVDYLQKEIFDSYGVPEVVVSDNGTQFKCKAFQAFLNKYGVKQQFTAIHSPQANASERVNRSINVALRSYIKDDQGKWDQYLSSINCALRNSVHQTIGMTPYEVVFGQSMITHGKDYNLLRKLKILEDGDSQMPRMDKFSLLRDKIQKKMREAYRKNERTYNLRSRNRKLDIGQEVVRRNFPQSSRIKNFSAKLAPTGVKAIVIRRVGNAYYELRDVSTGKAAIYHLKDIWE